MQDRPVCLRCDKTIEHSPVYEAPCGHKECPSACFHGICLMEWREKRTAFQERMRKRLEQGLPTHMLIPIMEDPSAE